VGKSLAPARALGEADARRWLSGYHAALDAGADGGLRELLAPHCELWLPGAPAARGAGAAARLLARWWSTFGQHPRVDVDILAGRPWLVADLVVTRRSPVPVVASLLLLAWLDANERATCLRYFFDAGLPGAHGGLL
jgi:hypothetical protein